MATTTSPASFPGVRLDDAIPTLTDDERASVVALTARVARDQQLDRAQTIELVSMLGLDEVPFVQRVLGRTAPATSAVGR